jgi:hypothetical protein
MSGDGKPTVLVAEKLGSAGGLLSWVEEVPAVRAHPDLRSIDIPFRCMLEMTPDAMLLPAICDDRH